MQYKKMMRGKLKGNLSEPVISGFIVMRLRL